MRATEDEIKTAYKRLAIQYHPDRNNGSKFHEEYFKKILEAYQTLSDKQKRDNYDLRLFYSSLESYSAPRTGPVPPPPAYNTAPKGYPDPKYTKKSGGYKNYANSGRTYAFRYKKYALGKLRMPKFSLQNVSLSLLGFACAMMIGVWIDQIMHRRMAEQSVRLGEYTLAIMEDSTYAPAYYYRSKLRKYVQKDIYAALEDINLAIQYQDQPNPDYYWERALANLELQRFKPALADFKKVTELNPKRIPLLCMRA